MKICSSCNIAKSFDQFYKSAATKDKFYPRCKDCDREAGANWYKNNTERAKLSRRKRQIKYNYGLEFADYLSLLNKQNGVCAICSKTNGEWNLAVDHCHETGKIRGLLCNTCNRTLGLLNDNPSQLRKAADYLESSM